ncbi:hypothetical protein C2E21_6203 [Chlorella sorokiniana]|uniref:Uncharacterized protein n=1 Tax=Chlorella sorokiniana TaxID=3076 RepID=A0A2P6TLI4_CHLSO|nr:hypothetical protein C2E21_6203 [Chlorella sorokiniana]|eukprot:PRW45149.1 hypothetical protein C2E21_6203 [Chlorella sorokiniana]
MASELSKFIEDELRKQGIQDDEEQRLLSNLRIAPLSVQSPAGGAAPATRGWSTGKKVALVVTLALLFGGLVALVINYRGHPVTTGSWRGAVVDPEAGVEALPLPPKKEQPAADKTQQQQPAAPTGGGGKQQEQAGKQQGTQPEASGGTNTTEPAEKAPTGEGQKKAAGEGGRRLLARLPPL